MSTLSTAILNTLLYSDHFQFPLTQDELYTRLIAYPLSSKRDLSRALSNLVTKKAIQELRGHYFLPSSKKYLPLRQSREELSQALRRRGELYAQKLSRLPFVLAILLTGSLAMNNTNGSDDIDLLIITAPNRLWLTRAILTLYTSTLGVRRTPQSQTNSGKLCLNLYLTSESLSVPHPKRSLYTAYELIQTVPLYDPYHFRARLLSANHWLCKYLPNFAIPKNLSPLPIIHNSYFLLRLESLAYRLQLSYMKSKITREYVTRNAAYFHPQDPGSQVLSELL